VNQIYLDSARLLTRVAPLVLVDDTFALKGGTAINLFVRDMPRLSVDLDLVFPDYTVPRAEALKRINEAIRHSVARLKKQGFQTHAPASADAGETKLLVREGAHHLASVPLAELRMLYSMAHLVVCPSRAEGFDYSGVEAMACGTPVLASDTAVHRWVYGDAAEYADTYDEVDLGDRLATLCDLPRQEGHLAELRSRGLRRAALYHADVLAPRWQGLLQEAARTAAGQGR
jgi:glycosyltransferase involved in cell wall biosynthesis